MLQANFEPCVKSLSLRMLSAFRTYSDLTNKGKSTPVAGRAGPEGSREVKAPRFLDNGTGWW